MKYLDIYKERIKSGEDVVGKWIKLNLQYVERGLANGDFFYDEKKAEMHIAFIETFCHHVEGKTTKVKLEPWQKYYIACIFGLVDKNGKRQFREIPTVMGRKQGKSFLCAGIELDVGFTSDEAGMQIYNIAPKLKQAQIIYNVLYQMMEHSKALSQRVKKRRTDIYMKQNNCRWEPIAFASKKSDGFNPYLTIFDEFAAWEGEAGMKMYNVMLSAGGARPDPLYIPVSTANYIDEGLYDELFVRGTSVLLGTSDEKQMLPFFYMIDDIQKWDDPIELRKAMPNLGISVSYEYLQNEILKAHSSPTYKAEFITKYANIKQNSTEALFSAEDINKVKGEELRFEDFAHTYAVGGIDLSQTTDLTAASVVIRIQGHDYIFTHFWLPTLKIKELEERDKIPYTRFIQLGYLSPSGENFVRYEDVTEWFEMLRKKYKIYCVVVGYDRYSAQYLVDDMKKYGYKMDDVIQGTNLTPVINEFTGYVRDGFVHTGTNGLLQAHMSSVALKKVAEDNRVRMIKTDSRKHIDGYASVIDAYTVRQKWWDTFKYRLENKKRKVN